MDPQLARARESRLSIQDRAAAHAPQFDDSDDPNDDQQDTGRNDFDEDMVDDDDNDDESEGSNESDVNDGDENAVEDEIGGYRSLPPSLRPAESSSSSRPLPPLPYQDVGNDPANAPLPPHLKDISSLAAWTVSTHKPGCGVAALRDPSPNLFWQSDGPQPHHLNIHFFKLVSIAHIRIYLDYEQDESYTPTKLHFLAGTGHHDLQDFCTMTFSQPKGWLDVDLSNAGGPNAFEDGELDDEAMAEDTKWQKSKKKRKPPGHGPTLRCRLVQLRILENHQNGKDTHLRGLQIFAVDESAVRIRRQKRISAKVAPNPLIDSSSPKPRASTRISDMTGVEFSEPPAESNSRSTQSIHTIEAREAAKGVRLNRKSKHKHQTNTPLLLGLREPDWMGEPVLR